LAIAASPYEQLTLDSHHSWLRADTLIWLRSDEGVGDVCAGISVIGCVVAWFFVWMPEINRCGYAQRWEGLIEKYGLLITTGEMEAIGRAC